MLHCIALGLSCRCEQLPRSQSPSCYRQRSVAGSHASASQLAAYLGIHLASLYYLRSVLQVRTVAQVTVTRLLPAAVSGGLTRLSLAISRLSRDAPWFSVLP
jgi:hypothetical protein